MGDVLRDREGVYYHVYSVLNGWVKYYTGNGRSGSTRFGGWRKMTKRFMVIRKGEA